MFDYRRKPKVDVDLHYLAHSQTRAAWVSAISAFLFILMSVIALYQVGRARDEAKNEIVGLTAEIDTTAHPRAVRTRNGVSYIPKTIATTWYLTNENKGDTPISVVGYDAATFLQSGSTLFYTGCDLDHDKQVQRPTLDIPPRLSRKLKILVGMVEGSNFLNHRDRIATQSPLPRIDQPNYRQGIVFRVHTMHNKKPGYRTKLASDAPANRSLPS
jgi:hypothetical protein